MFMRRTLGVRCHSRASYLNRFELFLGAQVPAPFDAGTWFFESCLVSLRAHLPALLGVRTP